MVILIPLKATDQLIQLSQHYNLSLPVPLSSGCASYLSPEEVDIIFELLTPFKAEDTTVAQLMVDLQDYIDLHKPVVPCDN
ncbi:hypothetical protein C7293_20155 [filamentous cyanobacterium CCT1]|nr:hypothetical protein C7293_20155 [filamentous cyanobacterium CCT1]PSN79225.1 hypothetical protein C8B47_12790 [filamentous cyanobacterium CCP4]